MVDCIDIEIQTWPTFTTFSNMPNMALTDTFRSYMTAHSGLTPKTTMCLPKMPIETAAVTTLSRKVTRLLKGEEGNLPYAGAWH